MLYIKRTQTINLKETSLLHIHSIKLINFYHGYQLCDTNHFLYGVIDFSRRIKKIFISL